MKIVVGGQIDKQKVYDAVKGVVGDRATVEGRLIITLARARRAAAVRWQWRSHCLE